MSLSERDDTSHKVLENEEKDEEEDTERPSVLVICCGSGTTKVGFGGDSAPKAVFPTIIGRNRATGIMGWTHQKDVYVGLEAQENRGVLKLHNVVENGIVTNWDDMEKIWNHAFSKQLEVYQDEHPVVLTASWSTPGSDMEKITSIMFDSFHVPALYIAKEEAVCLHGYGATSGTVISMGDGITNICPVYGGLGIDRASQRMCLAGRDVTDYFVKILGDGGHEMTTCSERKTVCDMKEKLCFVSLNFKADLEISEFSQKITKKGFAKKRYAYEVLNFFDYYSPLLHVLPVELVNSIYRYHRNPIKVEYALPDGSKMSIGSEVFRAPEVLFQPSLFESEEQGLHVAVKKAMKSIKDKDMQDILFKDLYLAGGSSMFPGLQNRLCREIGIVKKTKVHACPKRKVGEWIGCSVLSSLDSFRKMVITKDEYDETGATVVHRKCL